jgi:hypothetical protein
MRTFILTVLFMLVSGFASAADIDGKWEGEVPGMGGGEPMKISYTFKADGNTLTGTTNGMDGNDISIQDGKIEGTKLSYSLDFGMGQPMKFNGEIKGDTIELKMNMGDMGGGGMGEMPPIILKKAK